MMDLALGMLIIMFISALVVDWLLTDKELSRLRKNNKSNELQSESIVFSSSKLFCRIFDSVYGDETWTWKRFNRSAILSCLFVLFSIVIIGIENTLIGEIDIFSVCALLGFNTIIDFVSLQETRMVLKWVDNSKDGKLSHVAVLIILDLVFTTLIYYFLLVVLYYFFLHFINWPDEFSTVMDDILDLITEKEELLPFFISTFGTSIVWYAFVVLTFLTRLLGKFPLVSLVFRAISETTSPARFVVVIFTIPLVFIFVLFQIINIAL